MFTVQHRIDCGLGIYNHVDESTVKYFSRIFGKQLNNNDFAYAAHDSSLWVKVNSISEAEKIIGKRLKRCYVDCDYDGKGNITAIWVNTYCFHRGYTKILHVAI